MASLRLMVRGDVKAVASIHAEAFPNFLMTLLGDEFLREYYGLVVSFKKRIAFVAQDGEDVIGFVVGYVDPHDFYRELSRHKVSLALRAVSGIFPRPAQWGRLIQALKSYRGTRGVFQNVQSWVKSATVVELASIAVLPKYKGQGVGKDLVQAFCEKAFQEQAAVIYLTTDAENNEAVNRFYQKIGFNLFQQVEKVPGRKMNVYIRFAESK